MNLAIIIVNWNVGDMLAACLRSVEADLATLPVVVFGDEGGQHVVAPDLRELFRLLGHDSEILVGHDSTGFWRDADEPHSPRHDEYVTWLHRCFGLTPAADEQTADGIVEAARAAYGEAFARWHRPFLAHWDA